MRSNLQKDKTSDNHIESGKVVGEKHQNSLSQKPTGGSYSSYKTAEDRAAFIKQQAEQRMAERLAALGLKAPNRGGDSVQANHGSDQKEKEERLRKAEEEDKRREQERQRRLAEETPTPAPEPRPFQKKPPPPPSRKGKAEIAQHDKRQSSAEVKRVEQEIAETALKEQQKAQLAETKNLQ